MPREDRLHAESSDQRSSFERDRDRILYSSAFRRLGGVTQVVSSDQGIIFHNRLTHSLKVAQVGRRLAQRLLLEGSVQAIQVDPDVVEAACLAHDLGHPPFGHIGEYQLNTLVEENGDIDGYEGNAQSFRILTKLAVRFEFDGLNLTRGTLAATLKYPWYRDTSRRDRSKKWGAYSIDSKAFEFAIAEFGLSERALEASLMDLADDLAYSVHDNEDFHRAGLIPWALLLSTIHMSESGSTVVEGEAARLIDDVVQNWWTPPQDVHTRASEALARILGLLPFSMREPYQGTRQQRQDLRFWTSQLLGRYIRGAAPNQACTEIELESEFDDEVHVLKGLTYRYAICNPALAAQQFGQSRILRELFEDLFVAVRRDGANSMLPPRFRHLVDESRSGKVPRPTSARVVADCITSMTEDEAVVLHQRLRGIAVGSVHNPILR